MSPWRLIHMAGWLAAAAVALSAPPVLAQGEAEALRFAGTWVLSGAYQPSITTVEGRRPPLRPEAMQLLRRRSVDRRAGKAADPVDRCLPPGTPRIMWQPRPFTILVTPRKITFVHEFQHVLRHVPLGEALPPADQLDLSFGGVSAGRWEGDVLVVETAGLNDQTWLDAAGLPHSADLKVVERFRLINGATLEDRVTIDDPKTYATPWTARLLFKHAAPGVELKEQVCAEKLLDPHLRAAILREAGR